MNELLIEDAMEGMFLDCPGFGISPPVDVVLQAEGKSAVLFPNWWQNGFGPGFNLALFNAEFERTGAQRWALQNGQNNVRLVEPEGRTEERFVKEMRLRSDLDRDKYLAAVMKLKETLPELSVAVEAWHAAFIERPVIDAAKEMRKRLTRRRRLGSVELRGGRNRLLDLLVVDEIGQAMTVRDHRSMRPHAERWAFAEESERDIESFIEGFNHSSPYGFCCYGKARTFTAKGSIYQIVEDEWRRALGRSQSTAS